jgi:TolB-like protein
MAGSASRSKISTIGVVATVVIVLAAMGWWSLRRHSSPIPVLPLANLNQDSANDCYADGLTGEIIRNLSIIEGLTVRSESSSFAFKGKPLKAQDAGRQLEADYLVEGSVLRSDQQLRIRVQLVRASDDFPIWSGRYDRELTDIFAIQDEISRAIGQQFAFEAGARPSALRNQHGGLRPLPSRPRAAWLG